MKTYNVIRRGNIVYEGHTSKLFAYGRFVLNQENDGIVSHVFDVFYPVETMSSDFMKVYIHTESVIRPILLKSTSHARMLNSLNTKELYRQLILLPELPEQQKIGILFTELQSLIAANQRQQKKPWKRGPP